MAVIRERSLICIFLALFQLTNADVPYRFDSYWRNKIQENLNKSERILSGE
jgi:hypothetical protein